MASLTLAAGLLSPNFGLIFWTGLAFTLLLLLMSKFAWKPIISALNERETTIASSMDRAEAALAEAKKLQSDTEAQRRDAERQAQNILREAREDSEKQRAIDVEKTKAEMLRLQEQARSEIEREKVQALTELRSEVATMAISAAEKILKDTLDGDRQRQLVDQFIADLPKN